MQGFIQCLGAGGGAQTVAGDSLDQPAHCTPQEARRVTCQKFSSMQSHPAMGCRGWVERKGLWIGPGMTASLFMEFLALAASTDQIFTRPFYVPTALLQR